MFLNGVMRNGFLQNKVHEASLSERLLHSPVPAFSPPSVPHPRGAQLPDGAARLVLGCYFCFTSLGSLSLKFLSQVYAVVSLLSVS